MVEGLYIWQLFDNMLILKKKFINQTIYAFKCKLNIFMFILFKIELKC